jgi:catechol 2,3-dioxygenase-like lactoylglutathione lyase family enzyme
MVLGHLGINVPDLGVANAYYDQLMPRVGFERFFHAADQFAYRPANGKRGTYLFFYPALEEATFSRHQPGLQHLAFRVGTRTAVRHVHTWVSAAGRDVLYEPQEFLAGRAAGRWARGVSQPIRRVWRPSRRSPR